MFERIKKWYQKGIYTKANVALYVRAGIITPEQYKEITGEDYE